MLRRIMRIGSYAGLAASVLVGCSWPQSSTRSSSSSSALADRSSQLPVATQPRSADSRAASNAAGGRKSLPGGDGPQIDQGVQTTSEGAQKATMPDELAATLLETATVLELRGNLEAARQQYERALSIAPNDPKLLVSFARFADRHGQGSVAADLYQRVLECESSHPLLWSEAGLSLTRNGRGEAGLAACRKAVAAAPDHPRLVANLNEAESAVQQFRRGETLMADGSRDARHADDGNPTATIPVSTSTPGAPADTTRSGPRLPFSPGSTARQFERPLPPVPSSRRQHSTLDAGAATDSTGTDSTGTGVTQDERAFLPPTDRPTELDASGTEPPASVPNTKDFLPGSE